MLSYALGGVRTKKYNSINDDDNNYGIDGNFRRPYFNVRWGTDAAGFAIKDKEFLITKELQKYQNVVNQTQVKNLSLILATFSLNSRMLVAADFWFRNNGMPKIISTKMYSSTNLPFLQMTKISFPEKNGMWDSDSLLSLTSYAHVIRENLYKQTYDIEFVEDQDDSDDDYGYVAGNYDEDDD